MSLHSRLLEGLCFQIKHADRNVPETFRVNWFKASLGPSVKTGIKHRSARTEATWRTATSRENWSTRIFVSDQPPILSGPWWRHLDRATLYLVF